MAVIGLALGILLVAATALLRHSPYPAAQADRQALGYRIDLDHAPVSIVSLLPGIGPAKAQALLDHHRQTPLLKPADLTDVHGIGDTLAHRITPWIAFPHSVDQPAK